jgi:hypothetical protein
MGVIDLASGPLACANMVICLDKSLDAEENTSLLKSLRWVGFDLITLDMWMKPQFEVTSKRWTFLGMEL